MSQQQVPDIRKLALGAAVGLVLILCYLSVVIIEGGNRGVLVRLGSINETVLGEGIHMVTPFGSQVHEMSIRIQKADIRGTAGTKDLQQVAVDVVVNYYIDPTAIVRIYREVGDEAAIIARILSPASQEMVKAACAEKTAEELLILRTDLREDILGTLTERLKIRGIIVTDVSIANLDFSDEFDKAIEQKQIAQQQAQQARFLSERAKNEADAEVARARGQAEAQRLLIQTLTPAVLQKMAIEKWDGKMPQVVSDAKALPFLQSLNR
jgi:regulator of protease activity HflC (stomatin/prohibitin superfamily)